MDWDGFEAAWHDGGCRALAELAAAFPGERLYAAAFHLFYGDGTQILPPALAVNAESAVRHHGGYSTRFAAPEWRWSVVDAASDGMRPWYRHLTDEFLTPVDGTDEVAEALGTLEAAHDAAMARVCKAMTATARRGRIHGALPAGFFVAILEGQRGDAEADLIRASVEPHIVDATPGLAEYLREIETQ
ncbi:hypothetical protein ACFQO7_25355 [Catellatospora aurea]|uniref:DUF4304 domain-containing protein n=1 Tax=Catellatospora aurea TaxID=1337874 RepID=A0ABW2H148_9ACTN